MPDSNLSAVLSARVSPVEARVPTVPWVVNSRDDALAAVRDWSALLGRVRWPGRPGGSARAVAEALAVFAVERGGPRFAASYDELALQAGLHFVTCRNALHRLQRHGWLVTAEPPTPRKATVWLLTVPADMDTPDANPVDSTGDNPVDGTGGNPAESSVPVGLGTLGEDWMRWRAVGKSAALVWRACAATGPCSATDLAAVLHSTSAAVRHHLRRLKAIGAVSCDGQGLWSACHVGTELAAWYRVDGAADRAREHLVSRRNERQTIKHPASHTPDQPLGQSPYPAGDASGASVN